MNNFTIDKKQALKTTKETAVAVWDAMIYHTWRGRSWKQFQVKVVDKKAANIQIQKEIKKGLNI